MQLPLQLPLVTSSYLPLPAVTFGYQQLPPVTSSCLSYQQLPPVTISYLSYQQLPLQLPSVTNSYIPMVTCSYFSYQQLHCTFSYQQLPQLPAVTSSYLNYQQLPTVANSYLCQLPAVTFGYQQLPSVTCSYLSYQQLPMVTNSYLSYQQLPQLPAVTSVTSSVTLYIGSEYYYSIYSMSSNICQLSQMPSVMNTDIFSITRESNGGITSQTLLFLHMTCLLPFIIYLMYFVFVYCRLQQLVNVIQYCSNYVHVTHIRTCTQLSCI